MVTLKAMLGRTLRRIAIASLVLLAQAADVTGPIGAGRRAPGFALPDLYFRYHDLADYRGKVVLLEIMQTRCPKCQKLSQTLEKLKSELGAGVEVLGVVNPPDNQQSVAAFIDQFKITTPILFDCGQMAASYLRPNPRQPQIHLPHLYVIDQQGIIRAHYDPDQAEALQPEALRDLVRRLLMEKHKER